MLKKKQSKQKQNSPNQSQNNIKGLSETFQTLQKWIINPILSYQFTSFLLPNINLWHDLNILKAFCENQNEAHKNFLVKYL